MVRKKSKKSKKKFLLPAPARHSKPQSQSNHGAQGVPPLHLEHQIGFQHPWAVWGYFWASLCESWWCLNTSFYLRWLLLQKRLVEKDPWHSSRTDEEGWVIMGVCHMLDRFLAPMRAFLFWHILHTRTRNKMHVCKTVGVSTWSPPAPVTLGQENPSPCWFADTPRFCLSFQYDLWRLGKPVAIMCTTHWLELFPERQQKGKMVCWSTGVNLQTHKHTHMLLRQWSFARKA